MIPRWGIVPGAGAGQDSVGGTFPLAESRIANRRYDMERELRELFGVTGQPVVCTRVMVKDMNFDYPEVDAKSWILINDQTGKRTHVNTYDGKAGAGHDSNLMTYDLSGLDSKKWRKKINSYRDAEIADCPVAVAAE
jgi:hypothetical protein